MTSDKLDLSETNAMISEDEALNKMRDTVEQQFAELGDKVADCKKEFRTCKAGKDRAGRAACKDIRDNVCEPNAKQSNDANFKVYVECEAANQLLNGNGEGGGCEPTR